MSTQHRIKPMPMMPQHASPYKFPSLPDYAKVLDGISQGQSGPQPHRPKKRGPKVRVVRVVEYVGDYDEVQRMLAQAIQEKVTAQGVIIKGTTLGVVPEILNPQETKRLRAKLKAEKVKNKLLDDGKQKATEEFPTSWMGISRSTLGGQGGNF